MFELKGEFNSAKVFSHNADSSAVSQIIELCSQEFTKGLKIRVMPDYHAGKGCTIGTTMTIKDKVVPNLVGVDIGCGMLTVKLAEKDIDFNKLDLLIQKYVPCGFNIRDTAHILAKKLDLSALVCANSVNIDRAYKSIGTLGGGNHFIEIDKDDDGNLYLVIHSGSRHLGTEICNFYQDLAYKTALETQINRKDLIKQLREMGKEKDIASELARLPKGKLNKNLTYVDGVNLENYLNDMQIAQEFATLNRLAMAHEILKHMNLTKVDSFTTIHNYIETEERILRKGAVSAKEGEQLIIPINMRDGSLLCIGKGNEDWNYSAPHGAGRVLSRGMAKEKVTLEEFQDSMRGIFTSSVCASTIDESPMVYKSLDDIVSNINETAKVLRIIKPVYNFKSK